MKLPHIIESGRSRIILNECQGRVAITVDFDGSAGITMFLDGESATDAGATLWNLGRRMKRLRASLLP